MRTYPPNSTVQFVIPIPRTVVGEEMFQESAYALKYKLPSGMEVLDTGNIATFSVTAHTDAVQGSIAGSYSTGDRIGTHTITILGHTQETHDGVVSRIYSYPVAKFKIKVAATDTSAIVLPWSYEAVE